MRDDFAPFRPLGGLFKRDIREGDADGAVDVPDVVPLLSMTTDTPGIDLQRFHIAEDPVASGPRQGVLFLISLYKLIEGNAFLVAIREVSGVQCFPAHVVDMEPLRTQDLFDKLHHGDVVDLDEFVVLIAVRRLRRTAAPLDGRIGSGRLRGEDRCTAVFHGPPPGRKDRPGDGIRLGDRQPAPLLPDLVDVVQEGKIGPEGEQYADAHDIGPNPLGCVAGGFVHASFSFGSHLRIIWLAC